MQIKTNFGFVIVVNDLYLDFDEMFLLVMFCFYKLLLAFCFFDNSLRRDDLNGHVTQNNIRCLKGTALFEHILQMGITFVFVVAGL